jgi:hypothetical protein
MTVRLRRLLIAYDGGEPARAALELGIELAVATGASLGIVSVAPAGDLDLVHDATAVFCIGGALGQEIGAFASVDDFEPDVDKLAAQTGCANDKDATHGRFVIREVERRRPGGADDPVGRHRGAHRLEPLDVVLAVVHRVVRYVHDVVRMRYAVGQHGSYAWHGPAAKVDDAVKID